MRDLGFESQYINIFLAGYTHRLCKEKEELLFEKALSFINLKPRRTSNRKGSNMRFDILSDK